MTHRISSSRPLVGFFLALVFPLILAPAGLAAPGDGSGNRLEQELGRSESRIRSEPYPLAAGRTVWQIALEERLERLGYRRVKDRPTSPGEYFWGREIFWIYRPAHRSRGKDHPAELFGLALDGDGRILHALGADGETFGPRDERRPWLEPEILAEALLESRAVRLPIELDDLPEHVWRAVLAAEDHRFFDHSGVDARSLARAAVANVKAGGVAQGGSTITQQLIKNRDLTPKRTLGRKASEAVRALALESIYTKEEILETYLGDVYLGHVDGLAIHGLGTAAAVYFSKAARELDLVEAASLAAMIQGPNRLMPTRHAERLKQRRDWVLGRLGELGWVGAAEVATAKRRPVRTRMSPPRRPMAPHFRRYVAAVARDEAPRRLKKGRGLVAETTLDPILQRLAEEVVEDELDGLRRRHRRLARAPLGVALVALDASTGGILAYVGGDPAAPGDELDRARRAKRQPGSTIKPLLLLEAFERCGRRDPLTPATRVRDRAVRLSLESGPWEPQNDDGRFRGVVTVREALRHSLNVPFVRIGRHCGFDRTAKRLARAGLELDDPPPSYTLGAVETTPLDLAAAYTVFATPGRALRPRPMSFLERPKGFRVERTKPRDRRVTSPETAYLVRDLLTDTASQGTASSVSIAGLDVAAKTGTSSERRDAWLAGHAGSVVTVVWVGRDDGEPLGLTGAQAAAPIWRRFMERAVVARPPDALERPEDILEVTLDPKTGLKVRRGKRGAVVELFRRGTEPPSKRFWREAAEVVE